MVCYRDDRCHHVKNDSHGVFVFVRVALCPPIFVFSPFFDQSLATDTAPFFTFDHRPTYPPTLPPPTHLSSSLTKRGNTLETLI